MKKYKINKIKFTYFILMIIGIIFLAWLTVSWCEIILKNANNEIIYNNWNLLTLMLKIT